MVLNIRQKQTDAVTRLLHLNAPPSALGKPDDEVYKVLILDRFTKDVMAPLLRVNELRRHGITLHLMIENERQPIPDVPAVYLIKGTAENIQRLVADAGQGLYDSFHLNFVSALSRPLLEQLAQGTVAATCVQRIAKVYDQYLSFIALEAGLFSLGLPRTYLELNDPATQETQIEAAVSTVVDGLFSALVTLGVVPIIRCPKGGAAQHVAAQLDARLRDHLKARSNLFTEGSTGLAASLSRPLLCLFDRNFELSVVLQHAWTYKPLVHDVLGMSLNRITVDAEPGPSQQLTGQRGNAKKHFEVGEGDFFWEQNGRNQFPKVAEQVDVELQKYKLAIEELNRKTGSDVDPNADPNDIMQSNTRNLMSAVSALPELTERKRTIDKHTNLATKLLGSIKARGLDAFYNLEEDMLLGKHDLAAVESTVQGSKGTPTDKLRLVLVYLLTCEVLPTDADFRRIEDALAGAGADLAALKYVRQMRRMKLTGKLASAASEQSLPGLATVSQSHLLNWADKTFGQGLSSLTKGVKNLLAGEQQAAVTVAVEALMDGKQTPDVDSFATFDPKAAPGRASKAAGPFKEAIVFMIGGGNYLEYESLTTWASRSTPPKSVLYGATDLLSGDAFVEQLAELGRQSGAT
ncbi:hypothetical protein WJX72_005270 [[Myrmecia] bisecta]|uniref:Uncharacterized protein n=1 Tax=[Myrmecia] bisecta TaxID=41462 RepID=A0AAW1R6C3_9CHLO